jgi:osmotically-inducible protein OsmY
MANHNRNQPGSSNQEWHEKLDRRGEDTYGEGEPRYEDFEPHRRPFSPPATQRTHDYSRNDDIRNFGRGGYYNRSPYDVGNYASHYDEKAYDQKDRSLRIGFRPEGSRYSKNDLRGKGPRSYHRPDKRILEDICDQLYLDPYIDASDTEVKVDKGDVTLTGTVEDRKAKRRAEDIAVTVPGVKNIENLLRIAAGRT